MAHMVMHWLHKLWRDLSLSLTPPLSLSPLSPSHALSFRAGRDMKDLPRIFAKKSRRSSERYIQDICQSAVGDFMFWDTPRSFAINNEKIRHGYLPRL
eukprot:6202424-Pleurochrysis_carterae.AAC.2